MLNNIIKIAALAVGGVLLSQLGKPRSAGKSASLEESIEVEVPVSTAYELWTRFEDYPKFMENVHEVRLLDDTHLHWRAVVGGKEKEWDTEIIERIPYMRIAWRSIRGAKNSGLVSFHKISDNTTKVMLKIDCVLDERRDSLEAARMQAVGSLKGFKSMLENGASEAWRGNVEQH